MLYGQIDKFLVVGVAASHGGFWGNSNQPAVLVKFCEYVVKSSLVKHQSSCDFWILQHAGQLVTHRLGGQPVEFLFGQCLAHGFGGWVVEQECVQDDIGV